MDLQDGPINSRIRFVDELLEIKSHLPSYLPNVALVAEDGHGKMIAKIIIL